MNPEDLRLIEKRCSEATPYPWNWVPDDNGRVKMISTTSFTAGGYDGDPDGPRGRRYYHAIIEMERGEGPCKNDRAFIAAARTDVPLLLDEVQQQRRVIQQADRLFSFLWGQGLIDRQRVEKEGRVQELMHVLADLRVHAEWESTK